ncbi:hypothetical protein ACFSC4_09875 [Deinococcus malanensis]|uniref:hypothetical protein n=1 Tax=Deinococcus malanensis TaxID=1706855 RepID=UPI0036350CC4
MLFFVTGTKSAFAVVHLTWSEFTPSWPMTRLFSSLHAWRAEEEIGASATAPAERMERQEPVDTPVASDRAEEP